MQVQPVERQPTMSPFGWGLGRRLMLVGVAIAGLWLAVAWALDWWN